jgi:hypothetical protein
MSTEIALPTAHPLRWLAARAGTLCVFAIIGVLLAVAGTLAPGFLDRPPLLPEIALPWWALALSFAAADVFVLTLEGRRESQTIALTEIPLVLGLFFAEPLTLVAARVLASAVVMTGYRRSPAVKVTFNLALIVAETSVAIALFSAVAPTAAQPGPATWLAAYLATFAADGLAALAIACVIAVREGGVNVRSFLSAAGSQGVPILGTTAGLIAVIGLAASATTAWLLAAFGALLLVAFRAYASLAERHLNLERLYRFSQVVSKAPEVDDVMANVLAEARDLLRCEHAVAAFPDPESGVIVRLRLGPGGGTVRMEDPATAEDAWVIRRVIEEGAPLLVPRNTRDPLARRWLDVTGLRDACWRRSPTTPESPCATANSSAGCAARRCTTRSRVCPTGRSCGRCSSRRSPTSPRGARSVPAS